MFLHKVSSGPKILMTVTSELRMILQSIWWRVVDCVLNNISPSNIFLTMFFPTRFHQNCPSVFAAVSTNGLNRGQPQASRHRLYINLSNMIIVRFLMTYGIENEFAIKLSEGVLEIMFNISHLHLGRPKQAWQFWKYFT